MNDEQFGHYIETIQQHLAAFQGKDPGVWEEVSTALDGLQLIYEEMQASLEATESVEAGLLQQNQQIATEYQHYYELFHSSPIAYLVCDANGLILEANQTAAQLLNVPQLYLSGKPLTVYVAEGDRSAFRTRLNQLAQSEEIQVCPITFRPRNHPPLAVELYIAPVRSDTGLIEALRIGVQIIRPSQQQVAAPVEQPHLEETPTAGGMRVPQLPQSLDGLRVLAVDDEADVLEFITMILQPYGIEVRTVASAVAALEEIERFRPDVLMSDLRMPGEDGYSLIRQIRALEARQGWHIPAAAITAYLEEDREKALSAGFEAHLHKMAQPIEWVEIVARLAGQVSRLE